MEPEFSSRIFEKHSSTKFRDNPFSDGRVVSCRRTDRQTDAHTWRMLLVAFYRFSKVPKKGNYFFLCTIKAYEEEEVKRHSFATSALDVVSHQLHAAIAVLPVMITLYPVNKRMCGDQGVSVCFGEDWSLYQRNHSASFCINTCM